MLLWYFAACDQKLQLEGNIPNFTNLPQLTTLYLNGNELSGHVPVFSHLPELAILSLSYNQLYGNVLDITPLPKLVSLRLNNNKLTGTIPEADWDQLYSLSLYSNCGLAPYNNEQRDMLDALDTSWFQVTDEDCGYTAYLPALSQ